MTEDEMKMNIHKNKMLWYNTRYCIRAVSYTHLDVYKRQVLFCGKTEKQCSGRYCWSGIGTSGSNQCRLGGVVVEKNQK